MLAIAGGAAAVAVNEWRMPAEISQQSGGMVAFGDMVLFVLASGALALAPTFFLVRLAVEKSPRALMGALMLLAAAGPASWLMVLYFSDPANSAVSRAAPPILGLLIAFAAIPRMVAGPVLVAVEGGAFYFLTDTTARKLLIAAILMDLVPLTLFGLHMMHAILR